MKDDVIEQCPCCVCRPKAESQPSAPEAKVDASDEAIEAAQEIAEWGCFHPGEYERAVAVIQKSIDKCAAEYVGPLIEYFRGDGYQEYGWYGDEKGFNAEETAVYFLRERAKLGKAPSSPVPSAQEPRALPGGIHVPIGTKVIVPSIASPVPSQEPAIPIHEIEHVIKWAWDADNHNYVVSREILEKLVEKYAAPKVKS